MRYLLLVVILAACGGGSGGGAPDIGAPCDMDSQCPRGEVCGDAFLTNPKLCLLQAQQDGGGCPQGTTRRENPATSYSCLPTCKATSECRSDHYCPTDGGACRIIAWSCNDGACFPN